LLGQEHEKKLKEAKKLKVKVGLEQVVSRLTSLRKGK
jgi:hypothetical protein